MTPPIDEDYWLYRVTLTRRQAVVGFPKFGTIGIGFAAEEDWNTNLPYTIEADQIWQHIAHNKGDDSISDDDCLAAIRMIQDAAGRDEVGVSNSVGARQSRELDMVASGDRADRIACTHQIILGLGREGQEQECHQEEHAT